MSASGILANMRQGWNRDPAGHITGSRTGLSAALWMQRQHDVQEVCADPDPAQHCVSVQFSSNHATMFIDGRRTFAGQLRTGATTIVRAGDRPRAVTKGAFASFHIYVPNTMLVRLLEADGLAAGSGLELLDPRFALDRGLEAVARDMQAEMREGAPLSQLRVDALGQDLAIQLLRRHSNLVGTRTLSRSSRCGGLAPWQIQRTCEAMEAQLDGDLSLDILAALVRVSPTHFSRAFKQSTGLPPFAWLQRRRIERARELLGDPRLSLAEVALAVGFAAQPQFTTAFRRATGMTPGAWRRERLR